MTEAEAETGTKTMVGIVGLGYVGLPLAVAFAEAGLTVVGVDIDPTKISGIRSGISHVEDIPDERLQRALHRIHASSHYAPLARCDAIVIAVPTPLSPNREPDLTAMQSAAENIARVMQRGQLIVLESTTYPGTTREMVMPILSAFDLTCPEDYNLAFSPERVDPGNTRYTLKNTPKVIGGITPECTDRAAELYSHICQQIVPVSSPDAAELTKLLENIFRAVNIALVNELAMMCEKMDIDIWEVIDAASTKPYGFMRFEPGPGLGGHCIPIDPFYLTWRAREFKMATEFIELAGKINQQMPSWCVGVIEAKLDQMRKSVNGSKILILGISYKGGIGDMRMSPALDIIDALHKRGAILTYHDPYVPWLDMSSTTTVGDLDAAVVDADAVVLVTAHPDIDYHAIKDQAKLFIDLRGTTRKA